MLFFSSHLDAATKLFPCKLRRSCLIKLVRFMRFSKLTR